MLCLALIPSSSELTPPPPPAPSRTRCPPPSPSREYPILMDTSPEEDQLHHPALAPVPCHLPAPVVQATTPEHLPAANLVVHLPMLQFHPMDLPCHLEDLATLTLDPQDQDQCILQVLLEDGAADLSIQVVLSTVARDHLHDLVHLAHPMVPVRMVSMGHHRDLDPDLPSDLTR